MGEKSSNDHAIQRPLELPGAPHNAASHIVVGIPLIAGRVTDFGQDIEEPTVVFRIARDGQIVGVVKRATAGTVRGSVQAIGAESQGRSAIALTRRHQGAQELHPHVRQPLKGHRLNLIIVRNDISRRRDRMSVEPGLGFCEVGRNLAGGPGVEEGIKVQRMDPYRGLSRIDQISQLGGGRLADGPQEEPYPRFEPILVGCHHPIIAPRGIIVPEGDQGRHPLHHKGLAGGPDQSAPDQIVKAMDIPPGLPVEPVVSGPLDGAPLAVGRGDHEGLAVEGSQGRAAGYWWHHPRGHHILAQHVDGVGRMGGDHVIPGRADLRVNLHLLLRSSSRVTEAKDVLNVGVIRGIATVGQEIVKVDQTGATENGG